MNVYPVSELTLHDADAHTGEMERGDGQHQEQAFEGLGLRQAAGFDPCLQLNAGAHDQPPGAVRPVESLVAGSLRFQ